MATHVKVVAVLFIVFGALFVLGAMFSGVVFSILAGVVGASHDEGAPIGVAVLGLTGVALTAFLLVSGLPSIICGWGLLRFRPWARILGIILAAMSLIHFPWGTIFGVYALWVFFSAGSEALFKQPA